jgi:hypothetical protein
MEALFISVGVNTQYAPRSGRRRGFDWSEPP